MANDTKEAIKTFLLGTAVEVTANISVDTATTAKITVLDSGLLEVVTEANMTKSADGIYTYVFQSTHDMIDGIYTFRMDIASGGYTTSWEAVARFMKRADE